MGLDKLFADIANAIRSKKDITRKIKASNFPEEIMSMTNGRKVPILNAYQLFYKNYRNNLIEKINDYFDFSKCTDMNCMFYGNADVITIPEFDTSKCTNMTCMFQECINLIEINSLDTSKVIYMDRTFYYCKALRSLRELDVSMVKNFGGSSPTLRGCANLENFGGFLNAGKAFTEKKNNYSPYTIDLSNNNSLTHESLMNVINKLCDLNITYGVYDKDGEPGIGTLYTQQLILGSTNIAKLTAEEIAIATAKGWTVS